MHEFVEALYRRHSPGMTVALALATGDREAAEDLVHGAFERAIRREAFLREHPNPAGWLYSTGFGLARSRWRLLLRRRYAVAREYPVLPLASPAWEELADLRASLERLPAPQREVVILHHYLGYGVEEVAGLLGVAPGTVKSRLHRGRAALGGMLELKEEVR